MTAAALVGLSSGAFHAVTGPDHLLSLAPLSLEGGRRGWRVGLLWGLGHALGSLVCVAAISLVAAALDLDVLERWGERLAGAALSATGVVGLYRWATWRHPAAACTAGPAASSGWTVVSLGLIHGVTGAAALLTLLPAAAAGSAMWRALFLGGFAFGSTLAMAVLTAALAASAGALHRRQALLRHVPAVASAGSVALGAWWALG